MKIIRVYNQEPMDSHKSFYSKAKVLEMEDGSKLLFSYGTPVCKLSSSERKMEPRAAGNPGGINKR